MNLKLIDIQVQIQGKSILENIDLEVKDGELISLLGSSGCGKTTLLKTVAGLIPPSKGSVQLNQQNITHLPPQQRKAVIVFQDLRLFPHLTVEKNISFSMELQGMSRINQKAKVKELLRGVQLEGFEKRRIKEMSGGQLQRVALARALGANPNVLLLDEPFSGLEEKLRLEMGELVKKIQQENKITTVLVTHDKREALQLSQRIALMSKGKILQYDTPHNLYNAPKNLEVAEYFGKINLIGDKMIRSVDMELIKLQKAEIIHNAIQNAIQNPANGGYSRDKKVPDVDKFSADNSKIVNNGGIFSSSEKEAFQIQEVLYLGDDVELSLQNAQGEKRYCNLRAKEWMQLNLSKGDYVGVRPKGY